MDNEKIIYIYSLLIKMLTEYINLERSKAYSYEYSLLHTITHSFLYQVTLFNNFFSLFDSIKINNYFLKTSVILIKNNTNRGTVDIKALIQAPPALIFMIKDELSNARWIYNYSISIKGYFNALRQNNKYNINVIDKTLLKVQDRVKMIQTLLKNNTITGIITIKDMPKIYPDITRGYKEILDRKIKDILESICIKKWNNKQLKINTYSIGILEKTLLIINDIKKCKELEIKEIIFDKEEIIEDNGNSFYIFKPQIKLKTLLGKNMLINPLEYTGIKYQINHML